MKKIFKRIISAFTAVLMLSACLTLASCSRRFESGGVGIKDTKTGITYRYLPACYEPAARSKNEYAICEVSGFEQKFYTVEGLKPELWICNDGGDLLYSGDLVFGGLDTFDPSCAYLCYSGGVVNISFSVIESEAGLSDVIKCWLDSEPTALPIAKPDETYLIKFSSDTNPGIYYSMSILAFSDAVYIYNKYEGRCVKANDVIINNLPDDSPYNGNK